MTILSDHQFEILPNEDATSGIVFGLGAGISLDENGFHPPDDAWNIQDVQDMRYGGLWFGRDTLAGPAWGWDLFVDASSTETALASSRPFKTLWRARSLRQTPGAVTALRMCLNGETRRIYGRPRRYGDVPTNRILNGYLPITVDFQASDAYTYSDEEHSSFLSLTSGSEGGITFPTSFPFSTTPPGSESQQILVDGDAPAYPVYRINGPISSPSIETASFIVNLAVSVPEDDWIEIDTRPWKRSIRWKSGAVPEGALAPGGFLSDMVLEPGTHTLTLRGVVAEGQMPSCAVHWRETYDSY